MSGEMILYQTEDGLAQISLRAVDGTVWLTQAEIAQLFDTTPQAITQHIKTIYAEGELVEAATCNELLQVRQEGARQVQRRLKSYSLDMILAVGFRVRSTRGSQFRRWANTVLRDYLVKGFAMDDARLKAADRWDYFDEWLARIRDIRASEKRFYQKVKDLFTTAVDYDKGSDTARLFFQKVQNKMLWAVTGKTAAEIIVARADPDAQNMGLTSWKGSVVRKADVSTAKNYLAPDEIDELNRIVTMYLDFAEDQAKRRKTITMAEWAERLDAFLTFNDRDVLTHAGKLQADVAKRLAEERFDAFDTARRQTEVLAADSDDFASIEAMARDLPKGTQRKGLSRPRPSLNLPSSHAFRARVGSRSLCHPRRISGPICAPSLARRTTPASRMRNSPGSATIWKRALSSKRQERCAAGSGWTGMTAPAFTSSSSIPNTGAGTAIRLPPRSASRAGARTATT